MSSVARVLSGSLAAWSRIGVTILAQVAMVPIFLSFWSVHQYGAWLLIQAAMAFSNIMSLAHHNYVANEMLQVQRAEPHRLSVLLSAAVPYSVVWGLIEVMGVGMLTWFGLTPSLLGQDVGADRVLEIQTQASLLLLVGTTYLCACVGGLLGRVAAALGHYPRGAWWGVGTQLLAAAVPALAVVLGADLWQAAIALAVALATVHGAFQIDMWRLARRHGVHWTHPDWVLGWRNFRNSWMLGGSYLCGLLRQQGLRLLVGQALGAAATVAFTTMRTAGNLTLQAMATITDPLHPEFMRFLRERQQVAILGAMTYIWLVIVFAMGPALVALQVLAPTLFEYWTRGKVAFDAWTFAGFSAALLAAAIAKPAEAILLGNNLVGRQFAISALAAGMTVIGVWVLDGAGGLPAIAAVLVATEVVASAWLVVLASSWLRANGMRWPTTLCAIASAEVMVCWSGMAWISADPDARWQVPSAVAALSAALLFAFMRQLPHAHREWLTLRFLRVLRLGRTP